MILNIGAFTLVAGQSHLFSLQPIAYGYILLLGLTSVVGISFATMAVRTIGETHTAMLSLVEPVVSYLGGIVIFSEKMSLRNLIGSFIMLLVILVVIGDEQASKNKESFK